MKISNFIFVILITLNFSSLKASDRDNQLNKLFNELKINNIALVYGTEQKIWKIWSTHPTDDKLTLKLLKGTDLMQGSTISQSIEIFSDLIEIDPNWAEAWNKRATAF